MKRLCQLIAVLALAVTLGCGKSDLNKDLKPIDPNTPPPKPGNMGPGGTEQKQKDELKPPPIIK